VEPPRIAAEEIDPLEPEEGRRLLESARETSNRLEALYVLVLNIGRRQGELLALKRDGVDPQRGMLWVRRTLTRTGGSYALG
jgi:integrase